MPQDKKIVLVTGASRGIGRGIALAFRDNIVIGTSTTKEGADKISAALKEQNIQGSGMVLNVSSLESIENLIATIKEKFGPVSILVNNAAMTQDNLLLRMKEEEWSSVIETNLTSVFRLAKACLRDMIKARWGRIINISSVVGATGNAGQVNYVAAKAGLEGFTKSLAQEVGSRDVTVNAIAPGFIDTDMTRSLPEEQRDFLFQRIPVKRLGTPEDIAAAVKFLASNEAGYITGQIIHVNGGMYMA